MNQRRGVQNVSSSAGSHGRMLGNGLARRLSIWRFVTAAKIVTKALSHQETVNEQMLRSLVEVQQRSDELWLSNTSALADFKHYREEMGRLQEKVDVAARSVDVINCNLKELRDAVTAMDSELGHLKELNEVSQNVSTLIATLRTRDLDTDRLVAARDEESGKSQAAFSRWELSELAFQDAFRGSSEIVKARLAVYIDDLKGFDAAETLVLDIGCGRGDWLEVLRDAEISAVGVDTDSPSILRAIEHGVDARLADGIEFLAASVPESYSAITAFHVVEHLPLEPLLALMSESYKALRPGGLLIMETPNPENFAVATHNFYVDPTHLKPLPSVLLKFLVEQQGFADVEVRYLNRNETPEESADAERLAALPSYLRHALTGAQDYAVLARK